MPIAIRPWMVLCGVLFLGGLLAGCSYEQAFPRTPIGQIEVKERPPARILCTQSKGDFFAQKDDLFRTLYHYIDVREVEMTVPVAAQIDPAAMVFFLGDKDASRSLRDSRRVQVMNLPGLLVASAGARGGYSRGNFEETERLLRAWVNLNPEYKPADKAYAVFWDGPYTLWFLKRYEVHMPVERADSDSGSADSEPVP